MNVDVLVVGAGPTGLSAAIELRRLGVGSVLVADREAAAGGVPRHSWHTGYGLRDLRRVLTGPAYARTLSSAAAAAGAELRLGTTVTGWARGPGGSRAVTMTGPAGVETVRAAAVLLATGCRERPRPARLIPGDRPPGVMTTGELQQRVYLGGERLGGRALVIGAEHVSFSAVMTLGHAGARVHAAETADIAALSGRHAARHIAAFLDGERARAGPGPDLAVPGDGTAARPILVEPPLIVSAGLFSRRERRYGTRRGCGGVGVAPAPIYRGQGHTDPGRLRRGRSGNPAIRDRTDAAARHAGPRKREPGHAPRFVRPDCPEDGGGPNLGRGRPATPGAERAADRGPEYRGSACC